MENLNGKLPDELPAWTRVDEIQIVYKTRIKASLRPHIISSGNAYELLMEIWNADTLELQEEFKVLLLNRGNKVLGLFNASSGGLTCTVADPRLILLAAIKAGASSIVLAHNHPSGVLKPSKLDLELTKQIAHAAQYHDIKVLDHIIVTATTYFSFADEGLL